MAEGSGPHRAAGIREVMETELAATEAGHFEDEADAPAFVTSEGASGDIQGSVPGMLDAGTPGNEHASEAASDPGSEVDRRMLALASKRFGIHSFRPGQALAIRNVLAGIDTLAIMPTGGGKSLCYQLPALVMNGVTLVVSPLIALMKDQHDKLEQLGIEVLRLDSTLNPRDEAMP